MDELNEEWHRLAARYREGITHPQIRLPNLRPGADATWHQFVIHTSARDALQTYLKAQGIDTMIHYPIPPHLSEAYRYLGHKRGDFPIAERYADEVLSLPMYNGMTEEEQETVIRAIQHFQVT